MSTPATVQDIQNAIDKSKSVILSSMISRSDMQSVVNQVRMGLLQDLHALHAENKVAMNQAVNARSQVMQRLGGVEAGLVRLEQNMQQIMSQQSKTSSQLGKMQPADAGYLFQRI